MSAVWIIAPDWTAAVDIAAEYDLLNGERCPLPGVKTALGRRAPQPPRGATVLLVPLTRWPGLALAHGAALASIAAGRWRMADDRDLAALRHEVVGHGL